MRDDSAMVALSDAAEEEPITSGASWRTLLYLSNILKRSRLEHR